MRADDFDFDRPDALIALEPARPRDSARLLRVAPGGALSDHVFRDLPTLLRPGDLLVRNVSAVIPAALTGVRPARRPGDPDVAVKVNLAAPLGLDAWRAFARPGKRLREGDAIAFSPGLDAVVTAKGEDGLLDLRFSQAGAALDTAIAACGAPPLPPYIADRRGVVESDAADYQTVYAAPDDPHRSVAAPTAGLHFTPAVFDALAARGVAWTDVSLAVGAGTFLPVKAERLQDHRMHAESFAIDDAACAAIAEARASGGRVIAVGTTALRALESCARRADGGLAPTRAATDLFITPGYRFAVVDGLITNFHLPRSTLVMLVAAFCGYEAMRAAYAHAVAESYRFYSYGDASLLWRGGAG